MLDPAEALQCVMREAHALPEEALALHEALGRVLARDVQASTELPRFDNSAMDGYAVRFSDLALGTRLPVLGEARARAQPAPRLAAGTAMRIFTGAPLPEGADTVVIQENAVREGTLVRFTNRAVPGEHVRARGSDLGSGALAVGAGTVLDAGAIGLLAGLGEAALFVHRRPRVALFSTGDELVPLGTQPPAMGALIDSNAPALAAQATHAGAESWVLPTAGDDPTALSARLEQALTGADVVVTTGGVSVGDHDHMREAFRAAGIEERFWKVAIKPGKPVLFGVHDGRPVFALPGNPVSALLTFIVFVEPLLRAMQGDRAPFPARLSVRIDRAYARRPGRMELLRAELQSDTGLPTAVLHGLQGSGSLPSMAGAQLLVVVPAAHGDLSAAETLTALVLGGPRCAQSPF